MLRAASIGRQRAQSVEVATSATARGIDGWQGWLSEVLSFLPVTVHVPLIIHQKMASRRLSGSPASGPHSGDVSRPGVVGAPHSGRQRVPQEEYQAGPHSVNNRMKIDIRQKPGRAVGLRVMPCRQVSHTLMIWRCTTLRAPLPPGLQALAQEWQQSERARRRCQVLTEGGDVAAVEVGKP